MKILSFIKSFYWRLTIGFGMLKPKEKVICCGYFFGGITFIGASFCLGVVNAGSYSNISTATSLWLKIGLAANSLFWLFIIIGSLILTFFLLIIFVEKHTVFEGLDVQEFDKILVNKINDKQEKRALQIAIFQRQVLIKELQQTTNNKEPSPFRKL